MRYTGVTVEVKFMSNMPKFPRSIKEVIFNKIEQSVRQKHCLQSTTVFILNYVFVSF